MEGLRGDGHHAARRASSSDADDGSGAAAPQPGGRSRKIVRLRDAWREFCRSTAIHGLRYLAEDGRAPWERSFWAVSILLAFAGAWALIARMHHTWEATPAMATNELKMQAVWELPFPAVTVCPETKFKKSAFNLSEALAGARDPAIDPGDELQRHLNALALLCEDWGHGQQEKTISEEDLALLIAGAPKLADTVKGFEWKNSIHYNLPGYENMSGFQLWTPTLTDVGLCFSINMLSSKDLFTPAAVQYESPFPGQRPGPAVEGWSPAQGYSADAFLDTTYPTRALRGAKGGIRMLLIASVLDMDYSCGGPVQGFKVAVHSPVEVPHMKRCTRSLLGEELLLHVKTTTMSTSNDLRNYEPFERRCFFPEERQLRYFQVYTKKNCELECSSNVSRASCGCVAHFMPRSADIPVCGPGSFDCLRSAEETLAEEEIKGENSRRAGVQTDRGCNCLPACTSLEYDVDLHRATFDWEKSVVAWRFRDPDFVGKDCSRVSIYFKDTAVVVSNQRSELYSLEKFIAACAGVLGLFTGLSLINVIEAVYFASWGLWAKLYQRSRRVICSAE